MAFDGGVPLVEDVPGVHPGHGSPEELFHQQQPFVLHRHFGPGQIGVGAQHKLRWSKKLPDYPVFFQNPNQSPIWLKVVKQARKPLGFFVKLRDILRPQRGGTL
jgi:hypothetical protein